MGKEIKYSISLIRSELNLAIPCNANASGYIVNASAALLMHRDTLLMRQDALLMHLNAMPMHSKGMLMYSPALKTLRFRAKLFDIAITLVDID
ncbi:MAG: hypothetical protein V7K40_24090 [Nostoc sp.]|uniref:hypothetical protein n=1 Tax=Nostoc sp. TaxID=1180 RepID=UPI002FF5AB1C